MMNDTYGINIPYYITPSGFNSAIFFFPGRFPYVYTHLFRFPRGIVPREKIS